MLIREERVYELDNKIAPAILKLNKKGYVTEFSCEGCHKDEEPIFSKLGVNLGTYVVFNAVPSFHIDTTPNNWHVDDYRHGERCTIRKYFTTEQFRRYDYDTLVDIAIKELEEWVDKLPELYNPYLFHYDISPLEDFTKENK